MYKSLNLFPCTELCNNTHTHTSCCQTQGWHVSLCLVITCSDWALNVTCLSPLHLPDSSSLSSLCIWNASVCVCDTDMCAAAAAVLCVHACVFDGHTAALHLPLYGACKHNDAHCIDFLVPFYNYVSPLFIHPLSPAFSLSLIPSLLSPPSLSCFSNSIPVIHFYASLCPCLLSRTFLFFFPVFNFLSHLRHSAWFRFAPPAFALMIVIVSFSIFLLFRFHLMFLFLFSFLFSQHLFITEAPFLSISHFPKLFAAIFFNEHFLIFAVLCCFFCCCCCFLQPLWSAHHLHHSLTEQDDPVTEELHRLVNIHPTLSQTSCWTKHSFPSHIFSAPSSTSPMTDLEKTHAFFPPTPQKLPQVLTRCFLTVQTISHSFLESDQ